MIKKINFEELDLKGAFKIQPFYATDERGGFVKDYNIDVFKSNGIEHELKEVFYTISKRGVVRATHFQHWVNGEVLILQVRTKLSFIFLSTSGTVILYWKIQW